METSRGANSLGPTICSGTHPAFCVSDLVQQQSALTPDVLAIRAGSQFVTYRELDQRSSRLANHLLSLGAAPGGIVGVCLDRSVDFAVAALAILKSGSAYLPLESKTPRKRLQAMLKAAQASIVLTHSSILESLGDGTNLIPLDTCASEIDRCSSEAPKVRASREHLAYVIYTSGSTGIPKAVAIGHDSLFNLCRWHNRTFGVTPADRATLLSSIGFDAAVWELWPHLIAGASVHMLDDETRSHPEQLRDYLVREKITISFAPTPLAERMIQLKWPQNTALRFLLTGADTLRHFPSANLPFTLINNYGPTECTVVATSAAVNPDLAEGLPAIGRPIDNTEVYILNWKMQQVAGEEIGEIFVGGAGVARGYLNDPALTAERFVKHPFSAVSGATLYRTGDLGRWLPNGQIAFHGRVDDQVKIRGYRIELDEVAHALNRHPSVRESVVVASENGMGEKELIAFVVPVAAFPALREIRDFLAKELPEYMLPAKFVSIDGLPISSSGKIDRSALPAPGSENIVREQNFVNPSTVTEQRVAGIVASLLGLEHVGAEDNFFFLGGNSLFGTQLIARLRGAFGVDVPLLRLFDHPTVTDLAGEVERLMIEKLDAMTEEEAQQLLALNTEQARR